MMSTMMVCEEALGETEDMFWFFSPNISQWVWEEEKGVNTTHTPIHRMDDLIVPPSDFIVTVLTNTADFLPPFAALYPVYSVSIACISYNENIFFFFFGLVKVT